MTATLLRGARPPVRVGRRVASGVLIALASVVVLPACSHDTASPPPESSLEPAVATMPATSVATAPATNAPAPTTTFAKSSPLLDTLAPLKYDAAATWGPVPREIFESYVRSEQAIIKAKMAPVSPDSPQLDATLTGAIAVSVKSLLSENKASNRALKPPTVFEIRPYKFKAANEERSIFYACYTSNQEIYDLQSMATLESGTFSRLKEIGMQKLNGTWRMAIRDEHEEWAGK